MSAPAPTAPATSPMPPGQFVKEDDKHLYPHLDFEFASQDWTTKYKSLFSWTVRAPQQTVFTPQPTALVAGHDRHLFPDTDFDAASTREDGVTMYKYYPKGTHDPAPVPQSEDYVEEADAVELAGESEMVRTPRKASTKSKARESAAEESDDEYEDDVEVSTDRSFELRQMLTTTQDGPATKKARRTPKARQSSTITTAASTPSSGRMEWTTERNAVLDIILSENSHLSQDERVAVFNHIFDNALTGHNLHGKMTSQRFTKTMTEKPARVAQWALVDAFMIANGDAVRQRVRDAIAAVEDADGDDEDAEGEDDE